MIDGRHTFLSFDEKSGLKHAHIAHRLVPHAKPKPVSKWELTISFRKLVRPNLEPKTKCARLCLKKFKRQVMFKRIL